MMKAELDYKDSQIFYMYVADYSGLESWNAKYARKSGPNNTSMQVYTILSSALRHQRQKKNNSNSIEMPLILFYKQIL